MHAIICDILKFIILLGINFPRVMLEDSVAMASSDQEKNIPMTPNMMPNVETSLDVSVRKNFPESWIYEFYNDTGLV